MVLLIIIPFLNGPLNPMVNDHYPYSMAISLGVLTQHFQVQTHMKKKPEFVP